MAAPKITKGDGGIHMTEERSRSVAKGGLRATRNLLRLWAVRAKSPFLGNPSLDRDGTVGCSGLGGTDASARKVSGARLPWPGVKVSLKVRRTQRLVCDVISCRYRVF